LNFMEKKLIFCSNYPMYYNNVAQKMTRLKFIKKNKTVFSDHLVLT
jgi:hypothetical protein